MTDIKPELIEKARLLTDWSQHDYRIGGSEMIPYCTCGWTATKAYDVEDYDRHITETVLFTVADDLRAEAWYAGFDAGHETARAVQPGYPATPPNPYREEPTDD